MRKLTVLGAALVAVLAFASFASVASAANPAFELLSGATFPDALEGKATTEPELVTALGNVKCSGATTTGSIESSSAGKATVDFTGCVLSVNGKKCASTGDPEGTILISVTTDLVAYKSEVEKVKVLLAGLLFLSINISFTCGTITVKVTGNVIGLIGPINGSEGTAFVLLFDHSGAKQVPQTCELPESVCSGKTYSLKSNLGLGEEESAQVGKFSLTTAKDGKISA